MSPRRPSVPDAFIGAPPPRGRRLPRLRALPLAALIVIAWLPAAAFIRITTSTTDSTPVRWDLSETILPLANVAGGEVIYEINAAGSDNVGDLSDMAAVDAAFRHWEGIPRSKVAFSRGADTSIVVANDDGHNVIYWAEGTKTTILGTKNFPVSGFVSLPAVANKTSGPETGLLTNVDIVLNGNEFTWTTNPAIDPNAYDVEELVTHEVGHFIGLEHSGVVGSSMFARSSKGHVLQRTLDADDVAGASAVYPDQDFALVTGTQSGSIVDGFFNPVFGALVATLDAGGRVLGEAISQPNGTYSDAGLVPGTGTTYVERLDDPVTSPATNLFDETDLGGIYDATVNSGIIGTTTTSVTVPAGGSVIKNFSVGTGSPTIEIAAIGQRAVGDPNAVIFSNRPTPLIRGDSHVYMGVAGPGVSTLMTFEILGAGVTVHGIARTGSANGQPAVVYDVSVDPAAPLGLRSIRLLTGGQRTYATGAVDILADYPMEPGVPGLPTSVPPEVATGIAPDGGLEIGVEGGALRLTWTGAPSAVEYNLYRGDLATLRAGGYNHTFVPGPNGTCGLIDTTTLLPADLTDGVSHYYVVAGANSLGHGIVGSASSGANRPAGSPPCP